LLLKDFANDEAKKLLEISETSSANNVTLFSALFAGERGLSDGGFSNLGSQTKFFSSTEGDYSAIFSLFLLETYGGVIVNDNNRNYGNSVRCIKGGTVESYPCPEIPTVTYEGKTYNTVQIEGQCWLKENLNVGTRITSSADPTNNGIIEKYCYDNVADNCDIYGGLYQWNEAMKYTIAEGAQGICPDGWHIPTIDELNTLSDAVNGDGNALKALEQGSGDGAGTDARGFSALLAGRYWQGNYFSQLSERTYLWTSNESTSNRARYMSFNGNNNSIYNDSITRDEDGFSIRCLKD